MRLYRIALKLDGSQGFMFARSRREAVAKATAWRRAMKGSGDPVTTISQIEVEPTRAGIIKALTMYAGHPDNG